LRFRSDNIEVLCVHALLSHVLCLSAFMLFALALAGRILTRLKSLALVILSVFELILLATLN
jgi:hypothetical protein